MARSLSQRGGVTQRASNQSELRLGPGRFALPVCKLAQWGKRTFKFKFLPFQSDSAGSLGALPSHRNVQLRKAWVPDGQIKMTSHTLRIGLFWMPSKKLQSPILANVFS
eukprot:69474-Rhodomonas_salina.5